mmetsp:Transcript_112342/g.267809  ORF Transcript_112342/g.267809 Transcript_112342/m.267809 type:complete len:293 (+) Transcript_112342:571-1449(+)
MAEHDTLCCELRLLGADSNGVRHRPCHVHVPDRSGKRCLSFRWRCSRSTVSAGGSAWICCWYCGWRRGELYSQTHCVCWAVHDRLLCWPAGEGPADGGCRSGADSCYRKDSEDTRLGLGQGLYPHRRPRLSNKRSLWHSEAEHSSDAAWNHTHRLGQHHSASRYRSSLDVQSGCRQREQYTITGVWCGHRVCSGHPGLSDTLVHLAHYEDSRAGRRRVGQATARARSRRKVDCEGGRIQRCIQAGLAVAGHDMHAAVDAVACGRLDRLFWLCHRGRLHDCRQVLLSELLHHE